MNRFDLLAQAKTDLGNRGQILGYFVKADGSIASVGNQDVTIDQLEVNQSVGVSDGLTIVGIYGGTHSDYANERLVDVSVNRSFLYSKGDNGFVDTSYRMLIRKWGAPDLQPGNELAIWQFGASPETPPDDSKRDACEAWWQTVTTLNAKTIKARESVVRITDDDYRAACWTDEGAGIAYRKDVLLANWNGTSAELFESKREL